MSTTQQELLKLQTTSELPNTENKKSNSELIKQHKVENTGFIIIETEQGYFVTLGQYRLTEVKKTKQECIKMIKEKDWEILIALMGATIQSYDTDKTLQKQKEHDLNDQRGTNQIP